MQQICLQVLFLFIHTKNKIVVSMNAQSIYDIKRNLSAISKKNPKVVSTVPVALFKTIGLDLFANLCAYTTFKMYFSVND